jgi:hypothetical protein
LQSSNFSSKASLQFPLIPKQLQNLPNWAELKALAVELF